MREGNQTHHLTKLPVAQDGAHMNGHLYSLMLKTCADGGTPELLDLGMTVYHDLDCRWESRSGARGGTVSATEQTCVQYLGHGAESTQRR